MLTGGQPPGLTRREWHASSQHGVGCTVQIQPCRDVSLRMAKPLACSVSRSSFWSASAHHSDKQWRGWVLEDVPQVCTMCICSETSSWTKWRPTGAAPRSLLIPWRREVKGCTSQTLHPLETAGSGLAVPFSELCYWTNAFGQHLLRLGGSPQGQNRPIYLFCSPIQFWAQIDNVQCFKFSIY